MSFYNTGNPVPSIDPRDLDDNAKHLDIAVNTLEETWVDRNGTVRKSLRALEHGLQDMDDAFDAAQAERTDEFNEFLANTMYEVPVAYTAGLNITRATQTVIVSGIVYRPVPGSLPFVTTTFGADAAKWAVLGDASLRQDLADPSGSSIVGYERQPPLEVALTVAQAISLQPINIWERAYLVTNKPTPLDPSTWDWTPALQNLVDAGFPVRIPVGVFPLFTPVYVKQGTMILGTQGQGAGYIQGSFLKPTTSAFLTNNFDLQQVFVRFADLGFIGGTTVIDLGLFHEVDMTDCSFFNFSVGGAVIVRGEKHRFERIRMDARKPGVFGFSVGRWEDSVHVGYSDAYFGVDGAFFDRASFKDIALQGGAGGWFAYGMKANILSACVFTNFVAHGDKQTGETSVIWVRTRTQLCIFNGLAPDRWGSVAAPCPAIFDLAFVNGCTFNNVSPSFSGNNDFTNGIRMTSAVNSVFSGCWAAGDNVTKFGFVTGTATDQTITMLSCRGSFFHQSASSLVRRQVAQIGCHFEGGNNAGSENYNTLNQDIITMLMADANGSVASTATWGVDFANGGGTVRRSLYAKKEGPWINGSLSFVNAFGEASPIRIIVNTTSNVTPEGNVTANPGTLYLFYNGTSTGKLHVKESGTGNTGWVLK